MAITNTSKLAALIHRKGDHDASACPQALDLALDVHEDHMRMEGSLA